MLLQILTRLASPRLTVLFFLTMAAASLAVPAFPEYTTAIALPPLMLLLTNLAAAILSNPRFRADLPLLVFHLALLTFVALLAAGRLTYFDGGSKLTVGVPFEGEFVTASAGPWHRGAPEHLRFSHEGLVELTPDTNGFTRTLAQMQWWDAAGRPHLAEVGDDRPLVIDGYRIFATTQRGLSPVFHFAPEGHPAQIGTAHLDSIPVEDGSRDLASGADVVLPGGHTIWVQVMADRQSRPAAIEEDLGAATLAHRLILRDGERRVELRPGDTVDLPGGRFTYQRLSHWVGYSVRYDPTTSWLAATILVGVASLLAFYARLWRRPRSQPGVVSGVLA